MKGCCRKKHNHMIVVRNSAKDIDYDKLAESIVKANKKATPCRKNTKIRGFIFGLCNGLVYLGLCFFVVKNALKTWEMYIIHGSPNIFMCIIISVVSFALMVLLFMAQNETANDTDEEVFSHFNISIGIVSLTVAMIALLRG